MGCTILSSDDMVQMVQKMSMDSLFLPTLNDNGDDIKICKYTGYLKLKEPTYQLTLV